MAGRARRLILAALAAALTAAAPADAGVLDTLFGGHSARITHRYYDAGHMMYTRQADLAQLNADLVAWLAADPA